MKAVAAIHPGRIEVVDDVPVPDIEDYECLVRIVASGFCNGTDHKIICDEICSMTVTYPALIGHESVGEVVQTGARVKGWRIGDRMLNPAFRLMPGTRYHRMWGGMSEYAVVRDLDAMRELGMPVPDYTGTLRIPNGIKPIDAAVMLSMKETLSAIRNFGFEAGMSAFVYGDGPMGLMLARFLRLLGADWIGVAGHWDGRLEKARTIGGADLTVNTHTTAPADALGDRKVDLVIDAVGSPRIITEGAGLVRRGGKVGVTGVLSPTAANLNLLDIPHHTSIHLLMFPFREHDVHDEVVEMILDGRLVPGNYYSHVLPLERAEEALQLVESRDAFKVILVP